MREIRRAAMIGALVFAAGLQAEAAQPGRASGSDSVVLTPRNFASARLPSSGPARSIGGYAAGCVAGAVPLPPEGPGWQVIRLSRNRRWGHPALIETLRDLARHASGAGLGTLLIGDMGQPRGGPMPSGHASHTIGLDADIWLRLDLPAMDRAKREHLSEIIYVDYRRGRVEPAWSEAQVKLIRLAATEPRVERVFLHPLLKRALCESVGTDRAWLRKVRPWWGHDGHIHLRLACPTGNPSCESQKPIPEGDGCDEIDGWIADAAQPVAERPESETRNRRVRVPAQCRAVLDDRGNKRASLDSFTTLTDDVGVAPPP